MRHPILCLFMIFAFTIVTASPYMNLNAAELWNSQSRGTSSGEKTYYNKRHKSEDGKNTLYNRKNTKRRTPTASRGLRNNIKAYKNMRISRETKSSRLWKFMSPIALRNRQADVERSLQREYDIRRATRAMMIAGAKSREAYRLKSERKHKTRLEELEEKRKDRAEKRAAKKWNALYNSRRLISYGKNAKTPTRNSRSTGLKKPKRLFNDPND